MYTGSSFHNLGRSCKSKDDHTVIHITTVKKKPGYLRATSVCRSGLSPPGNTRSGCVCRSVPSTTRWTDSTAPTSAPSPRRWDPGRHGRRLPSSPLKEQESGITAGRRARLSQLGMLYDVAVPLWYRVATNKTVMSSALELVIQDTPSNLSYHSISWVKSQLTQILSFGNNRIWASVNPQKQIWYPQTNPQSLVPWNRWSSTLHPVWVITQSTESNLSFANNRIRAPTVVKLQWLCSRSHIRQQSNEVHCQWSTDDIIRRQPLWPVHCNSVHYLVRYETGGRLIKTHAVPLDILLLASNQKIRISHTTTQPNHISPCVAMVCVCIASASVVQQHTVQLPQSNPHPILQSILHSHFLGTC